MDGETIRDTVVGADDELAVTCPSGMTGSFRGLVGKDYRNFNRQSAKTGEGFTKILNACFTVAEPGIYKVVGGRIDWADCLIGDHTYGLMAIRRAMYPGQPYQFRVTCAEKSCRSRIDWNLPLEDLPLMTLPESSRQVLAAGHNEFDVEVRGRRVWYQLLKGRDQMRRHKLIQHVQRRLEGAEMPTDMAFALATRITRAEGLQLGAGDVSDFEEKVRWVEELPTRDHMQLLTAFEKADCGVETRINVICKECGAEQGVELPLDERFLFAR